MPTYSALPDAELLVIGYLNGHGFAASTDLPTAPTYPLLTVNRIGGIPVDRVLDVARLQVDAWGASRASAGDYARSARAALLAMPDSVPRVTAVLDDLGLSWQPDTVVTPPRPRFLFGVAVYLRP